MDLSSLIQAYSSRASATAPPEAKSEGARSVDSTETITFGNSAENSSGNPIRNSGGHAPLNPFQSLIRNLVTEVQTAFDESKTRTETSPPVSVPHETPHAPQHSVQHIQRAAQRNSESKAAEAAAASASKRQVKRHLYETKKKCKTIQNAWKYGRFMSLAGIQYEETMSYNLHKLTGVPSDFLNIDKNDLYVGQIPCPSVETFLSKTIAEFQEDGVWDQRYPTELLSRVLSTIKEYFSLCSSCGKEEAYHHYHQLIVDFIHAKRVLEAVASQTNSRDAKHQCSIDLFTRVIALLDRVMNHHIETYINTQLQIAQLEVDGQAKNPSEKNSRQKPVEAEQKQADPLIVSDLELKTVHQVNATTADMSNSSNSSNTRKDTKSTDQVNVD